MTDTQQETGKSESAKEMRLKERSLQVGNPEKCAHHPDQAPPARRRFRPIQLWICLLFFIEGILGWWVLGWPALMLCVLGTVYMAQTARRSQAQAGAERASKADP